MAVPVRALHRVDDPTYGQKVRSRKFTFDGHLSNQFIFQQEVARVCEVDCHKICLYREDLAGNFVPMYRDNKIVNYDTVANRPPLEIFVQNIDELDEAAEKAWRGGDLESGEIHAYRHFLKKLCKSRLLHKSFSFDDCPRILLKGLIPTPENEATARRIFEDCKVHFVDETNEKHLVQIPMLKNSCFKEALIFDKDFIHVYMSVGNEGKLMLPLIDDAGGYRIVMRHGDSEAIKRINLVSFLDVDIKVNEKRTDTHRAYFFLGTGEIPHQGYEWVPFNRVVKDVDAVEKVEDDTLPILKKVYDLLFGQ